MEDENVKQKMKSYPEDVKLFSYKIRSIIYGTVLNFEGNRAIVLNLYEEIPEQISHHCISLALRYHRLKKHLFQEHRITRFFLSCRHESLRCMINL